MHVDVISLCSHKRIGSLCDHIGGININLVLIHNLEEILGLEVDSTKRRSFPHFGEITNIVLLETHHNALESTWLLFDELNLKVLMAVSTEVQTSPVQ